MPPTADVGFCSTWPPGRPSPDNQGILVIAVDLDLIIPSPDVLDDDERRQGERLRSPVHRQLHLAAHTVLRQALGLYLDLHPAVLRIARTPHGKPYLPDHAVAFNLSHCGPRALIALAREGHIGVDLEHHDHLGSPEPLSERILAPIERSVWLAMPAAERVRALVQAWTRKEAVLKAIGLGLPGGMEHVIVGESPLHVSGDREALPALAGVQVIDLPIDPGYAAALAADGPLDSIERLRWVTT